MEKQITANLFYPAMLHPETAANAIQHYYLEASQKKINVAGEEAELLLYNNAYPGPLLELKEGEKVQVHFKNSMAQETNLHLHGLFMSPEEDKPHLVLHPGEETTHTFELEKGSAGIYWYHPHPHGKVARQLFKGLAGPIIVRGPQDVKEPLASAQEQVLVLQDISLERGKPAKHTPMEWGRGKEGRHILVNGQLQPQYQVATGLLRLRLLNASTARYYHLQITGKKLHIISHGVGYLEQPVEADDLLLSPGERADVLIQATEAALLELRNMPYSRTPFGSNTDTPEEGNLLASFLVTGEATAEELPDQLGQVEQLDIANAAALQHITFGATMQPLQFLIDGKAFDHHRVDLQARVGTLEVWDIVNPMGMDHPFHLHTFPFQVITRNGKPEPYRAWRDVVNVAAKETVRIAIPFRKYTGIFMYHCHILEHEDFGMMGQLQVK